MVRVVVVLMISDLEPGTNNNSILLLQNNVFGLVVFDMLFVYSVALFHFHY